MKKRSSILRDLGKEKFQELCDESNSIKEILEKVNLSWNGSANYRQFRNIAKEFEIDLERLENNRNKYNVQKLNIFNASSAWSNDMVFCKDSKATRNMCKMRIRRDNLIEYKCHSPKCSIIDEWNGEKVSLHLEHKNGINDDHRLENLEFLCPNCHSQTKTYAGKNKVNKEKKLKNKIVKKKQGDEKKELLNKQRKEFIDSIDTMKLGWVQQVANEWEISHTQVRRWVKKYYPELKKYERQKS